MDIKRCKVDNTLLIKKETKKTAERFSKAYYYTAYYLCPKCKRMYHDDAFKVTNNTGDLFPQAENFPSSTPVVEIWTDGACTNNGTPFAKASWGFVSGSHEEAGLVEGDKQTNNRGEGLAIYHALVWAAKNGHKRIKIHSDSQITLHGVLKHPDKVKENRDIFTLIFDLIHKEDLVVEYIKVRGHSTDVNNIRADKAAISVLIQ